MKKLYWRSDKIPQTVLALVAVFSLVGIFAVEHLQVKVKQPYYKEKYRAATLAKDAMDAVKQHRLKNKIAIDRESDPAQTGMIGRLMSPITSNKGHLPAKQTSVNPNFAALVVHYLKKARVQEGDYVAVGASGSFPALDIAVYAAIHTLKLKPIIITSASASQWGANIPNLSWLDMENVLRERKIFSFKSHAASIGGIEDRGIGMDPQGKDALIETISKYQVPVLTYDSLDQSIAERIRLYNTLAGDKPIKAYINVGGGQASVGTKNSKIWVRPGLNKAVSFFGRAEDSVMLHFVEEDIPIINLTQIKKIAERFGMPVQPQVMPPVGEGNIYFTWEYNIWLAGILLGFILLVLFAFIRSDWGYRILQGKTFQGTAGKKPQQMV